MDKPNNRIDGGYDDYENGGHPQNAESLAIGDFKRLPCLSLLGDEISTWFQKQEEEQQQKRRQESQQQAMAENYRSANDGSGSNNNTGCLLENTEEYHEFVLAFRRLQKRQKHQYEKEQDRQTDMNPTGKTETTKNTKETGETAKVQPTVVDEIPINSKILNGNLVDDPAKIIFSSEDETKTNIQPTSICSPSSSSSLLLFYLVDNNVWHAGILPYLTSTCLAVTMVPTCRRFRQLVYEYARFQISNEALGTKYTSESCGNEDNPYSNRTTFNRTLSNHYTDTSTVPTSTGTDPLLFTLRTLSSFTPIQWLKVQEQIILQQKQQHESEGMYETNIATDSNAVSNNPSTARTAALVDPMVPIPTLLLPYPIHVSNAGDEDYNGIYYCTECNSNGYVFTKPRRNQPRVETSPFRLLRCYIAKRFSNETLLWYMSKELSAHEVLQANQRREPEEPQSMVPPLPQPVQQPHLDTNRTEQTTESSCSRRHNDNSNEKRHTNNTGPFYTTKIQTIWQSYSFWAPLLVNNTPAAAADLNRNETRNDENANHNDDNEGDGNHEDEGANALSYMPLDLADLCRYPSVTNQLQIQQQQAANGNQQQLGGFVHAANGWQSLPTTQHLQPPIVELAIPTRHRRRRLGREE